MAANSAMSLPDSCAGGLPQVFQVCPAICSTIHNALRTWRRLEPAVELVELGPRHRGRGPRRPGSIVET